MTLQVFQSFVTFLCTKLDHLIDSTPVPSQHYSLSFAQQAANQSDIITATYSLLN